MADRIQLRRDTAAAWALANPVLADGEMGWERDTWRIKVGDAVTAWNDLNYFEKPDLSYVHEQQQASDVWVISHGLGKFPSITIVDSAGDECEGDVTHNGVNQTTVSFSAAFAGRAFCN